MFVRQVALVSYRDAKGAGLTIMRDAVTQCRPAFVGFDVLPSVIVCLLLAAAAPAMAQSTGEDGGGIIWDVDTAQSYTP
jgi:hypothetical protein